MPTCIGSTRDQQVCRRRSTQNKIRCGEGGTSASMLHCYMPGRGAQTGKTTNKVNQPRYVEPSPPLYARTVPCRRPKAHTPIHPLSHRTQQERKKRTREPGTRKQARKKTETHTRAEAGKKRMPGRRAGQRRVDERVTSNENTQETGGSQQPSKGRAQQRGHGKHMASTTPQQITGEGGTRGTEEGQHHAPRQAPHRHHTHRTPPHPRPKHMASGPWQPAQRLGTRERGGA